MQIRAKEYANDRRFFAVGIVQPRFAHGGACFCMAQWAYSNHPADASYSSSLSRCTLPEPVFLFFTHSSGCAARLTYISVARRRRWGGDGTVSAPSLGKQKMLLSVGYPRVYVVILMLEQRHRRPPHLPPSPAILVASQLAETDGLAQLRLLSSRGTQNRDTLSVRSPSPHFVLRLCLPTKR